MSRRPRPQLRVLPIRPSLEDAEGPDFALLLTQTLRADLKAAVPAPRADGERPAPDIAARVVERLRRDPGMIGERMRFASDRHRRMRSAACRVTAVVLVLALALVAGRIEPTPRAVERPPGVEFTVPGARDAAREVETDRTAPTRPSVGPGSRPAVADPGAADSERPRRRGRRAGDARDER